MTSEELKARTKKFSLMVIDVVEKLPIQFQEGQLPIR